MSFRIRRIDGGLLRRDRPVTGRDHVFVDATLTKREMYHDLVVSLADSRRGARHAIAEEGTMKALAVLTALVAPHLG
jgi:hypothetical protein